jgi:squalene cyclase
MIKEAIDQAITFLLSQRNKRGWWKEFDTLAGASDEWVTAYVGGVLAEIPHPHATGAARKAWAILRRRRWWSQGWGYNGYVPADADSTLWSLRLATRIGMAHSVRARRALRFLLRHQQRDGGIVTYVEDKPIRLFTRLNRGASFEGWCGTHTCVTAAAGGLQEFRGHDSVLNYLRLRQSADGSWDGYWWCDREYTTSLAVEALATSVTGEDIEQIEKAVQWVLTSTTAAQRSGDPPFVIALRVLILARARDKQGVRTTLEGLVNELLRAQLADGSWPPSARLRIPPPHVTRPEEYVGWVQNSRGGGSIQVDSNRCFTTATSLRALHEAEKRLG